MKRIFLTMFCLLLASAMLLAQTPNAPSKGRSSPATSGTCGGSPLAIPDGFSGLYIWIAANAHNWYFERLQGGHSYVVEAWDPVDDYQGQDLNLALTHGCSAGPSYSDVSSIDPNLSSSNSARISWIQVANNFAEIDVFNSNATHSYNYYLRITDTTLHNPRWTTWSGFITQYGFINTTGSNISGVLTVTDGTSGTKYTVNVTVPAGGQVFKIISGTGSGSPGLNLPPNRAGFADFAYIGPVGAVAADAFYLNSNATVVVPSTFAPRDYQH